MKQPIVAHGLNNSPSHPFLPQREAGNISLYFRKQKAFGKKSKILKCLFEIHSKIYTPFFLRGRGLLCKLAEKIPQIYWTYRAYFEF